MKTLPVPPPERGLPHHGRRREELLRVIEQEQLRGSLRRRWGLPLGVAGAVAATSVAAAMVFSGGAKDSKGPVTGPEAGSPVTSASAPTSASVSSGDAVPSSRTSSAGATPSVDPASPVITVGTQAPLSADRVQKILKSCLSTDEFARFQPVIAVSTAIPTKNEDAIVIAKSGAKYVACVAKGDRGQSNFGPAEFTLDAGLVRERDSGTDSNTAAMDTTLLFNYGLVRSDVAKVTVSYGTEKQEYPALLTGGAYLLTTSTPFNPQYSHPVVGIVHAYDASRKLPYITPLDTKK